MVESTRWSSCKHGPTSYYNTVTAHGNLTPSDKPETHLRFFFKRDRTSICNCFLMTHESFCNVLLFLFLFFILCFYYPEKASSVTLVASV